ncbi:putative Zinc finger, CCHC-type [Plasmopara halstedii]
MNAKRIDVRQEQHPRAWLRIPCTSCHRSYKFYCPECNIALGVPKNVKVPTVRLPLQVHVWFQDKIKKSTAPHAKVLAPKDVHIIPYPPRDDANDLPVYTRESTLVVYPSFEAQTLEQFSAEKLRDICTFVFIDCPWQKAPVILNNPAIATLRHVKLARPPKESNFWRYHKAGAGCVSTIEAIQLMLEEYAVAAKNAGIELTDRAENSHLSDLLFFFNLQFTHISEHFEDDANSERKPPMDAAEKERRRMMCSQKEKGKRRKFENRLQTWNARSAAIQAGEQPPLTAQSKRHRRCYNCKGDDHHSKDCPQPCRYCGQNGHFSANCSMKQAAYEREMKYQQTPRTKAL